MNSQSHHAFFPLQSLWVKIALSIEEEIIMASYYKDVREHLKAL